MTVSVPARIALGVGLSTLLVAGCTAQQQELLEGLAATQARGDSLAIEATSSGGTLPDPSLATEPTWFTHRDGYAMELPPGWLGVAVRSADLDTLIAAVSARYPAAGDVMVAFLDANDARVSMVAAPGGLAEVPPFVLVLAHPTDGRRAGQVTASVTDAIGRLPGLRAAPLPLDVRVGHVETVRYDFDIDDPELGPLTARAYLFRFAGQAYLVAFAAPSDSFEEVEATFTAIIESLRFGV